MALSKPPNDTWLVATRPREFPMPVTPPTVHPAHFDVLVALAAQDHARLVELLSGRIFDDDAQVWQFLNAHRLWDMCGELAAGESLSHCWSGHYAKKLAKRLELNHRRRASMREALNEIQDEFLSSRLESILLKGFVYGGLYYPHPDCRHQYDLDLLVKDEALEDALHCLDRIGFLQKRRRSGLRRTQRMTEHAVSLYREDVGVDLHWRLRNLPAYNIDYRRIWAESRHVTAGDRSHRTLSVPDTLASQMVAVFHDVGRGGFSQKGLLDLYLMMRAESQQVEWSSFRRDRLSENTWQPCLNVLAILLHAFPCRSDFPQVAAMVDAEPNLIVAKDDDSIWRLLEQPRGSLVSYLWTCRVYPVSWLRDGRWLLLHNLPHPGRIPLVAVRSVRFLWRALEWAASSPSVVQRRQATPKTIPLQAHATRPAPANPPSAFGPGNGQDPV